VVRARESERRSGPFGTTWCRILRMGRIHPVTAKALAGQVLGPRLEARVRLLRELRRGEPELRLLPRICCRATSFLDVGANKGIYSVQAARYSRHVYAVEAHPGLAERLRRTLGGRGTVFEVAASDHEGQAVLSVPVQGTREIDTRSSLEPEANPGFELREVPVRAARIDDLGLQGIGVVKIDVEGHELAVLRGAHRLLVDERPVVIVECEERHHQGAVAELRTFFADLGFVGRYLHDGRLHPVEGFDPGLLQSPSAAKPVGAARTGEYVNNFVFAHADDPRLAVLQRGA
jgi:FkbM family methyltransferase